MPLPENWKGLFYGPETMAHALVDWEPGKFVGFLVNYPDDPVFLIGGACFDLRLHDMDERADALLKVAEGQWPTVPWFGFRDLIPKLVEKYRALEPEARMTKTGRFYEIMQTAAAAYHALAAQHQKKTT